MIGVNLHSARDKLENLFDKYNDIPVDDWELKANWTKYLCVMVSGHIEITLRTLLSRYCDDKASPFVVNYVSDSLKNFQNPKYRKIEELLRKFNPEWANSLEDDLDESVKSSIGSIVANKNRIAHGEDVTITFQLLSNYYKDALRLLDKVEEYCVL